MKISIGAQIVDGPWGGGNLFVKNFSQYLKNLGHNVVYDLKDKDIDAILLTDPRSKLDSSSAYNHVDIKRYKKFVNPNVVVIQRINECDERKGTKNINNLYLEASKVADRVIFVSEWLQNIYISLGMDETKTKVIYAGADKKIFNLENTNFSINKLEKIKLVTHHWSDNWNKGFDIYKRIDDSISENYNSYEIEFTYIGNVPKNFKFKKSRLLNPIEGLDLATELKRHDIYVTASINEPSGNHHIEAAQCGLPIIYRNSGGIPEYCEGFGVSFENDFFNKLDYLIENYDEYVEKVKNYPNNSNEMSDKFFKEFKNILDNNIETTNLHKPYKYNLYKFILFINRVFELILFNKLNKLILYIKNNLK